MQKSGLLVDPPSSSLVPQPTHTSDLFFALRPPSIPAASCSREPLLGMQRLLPCTYLPVAHPGWCLAQMRVLWRGTTPCGAVLLPGGNFIYYLMVVWPVCSPHRSRLDCVASHLLIADQVLWRHFFHITSHLPNPVNVCRSCSDPLSKPHMNQFCSVS